MKPLLAWCSLHSDVEPKLAPNSVYLNLQGTKIADVSQAIHVLCQQIDKHICIFLQSELIESQFI